MSLLHSTRAAAAKAGAVRYFTGKPCKHGHIAERFTSGGNCAECLDGWKKTWRNENPEKRKIQANALRALNPQKYRDRDAAWRTKKGSREIKAQIQRVRIARKRKSVGSYNLTDIAELLAMQNRKCAYCYRALDRYEIDHIVPIARGGSNDRGNIQITCVSCNKRKHKKDPIRFAQELGRLI